MTKTTTNLLLMLITILAGTYFYITCCSSCGASTAEEPVKEAVTAPVTPEATSYPFAFSDGDYAYNENDNYNFNVSSSSILMPLSQKVTDGIASLKAFLAENAGKVINLTGYYKSDETNDSAFPNLGLARANAVKNHLVENGISSTQINTMGKLMDEMVAKGEMFLGPIAYGIGDAAPDAEDEMKALRDKINANPLVLYFETNQASISLSAEQRQKVADISRYLDKVEGASCNVVGHTDNVGRRGPNVRLGQGRADFAKSYLVRNGIAATKINASSKGPDSPVESNATEEGRAKNRRTEVTLN
ncbi:cell envelope biogenesis protein OmpA [Maribacter algarum]|uniref:Cell envelope biogenesis protein OmpA n=1 Tax=Maribacter algarum (ex Zhang et al. 2020) TaxID=2578118 RepID=A0A5S3PVY8_9FLAO|nr:OmpA family protein [Maribacter algarum]TMM59186.1 cell envelope biogenesis protein OmpA [Maribacter algarum]